MTQGNGTESKDLTDWVSELLEKCVDEGLDAPLVFVWVTSNGSVAAIKYSIDTIGDMVADVLAEHVEPGGLGLPINCLISDRKGAAIRATIKSGGINYFS